MRSQRIFIWGNKEMVDIQLIVQKSCNMLVAWLLLFTISTQAQIKSKNLCVRADFLFVIDISSSVSSDRTKAIVDAFMAEVERYTISEDGIRIGFIVFNGGVVMEQAFTADRALLLRKIREIEAFVRQGRTDILAALNASQVLWEESLKVRGEINRALVLFSDGDPGRRNSSNNGQYNGDDDDIKVNPEYQRWMMGQEEEMPLSDLVLEMQAAETIKTMAKTIYERQQNIHLFTINIATGSYDETHLKNLASPDEVQPFGAPLLQHYLGKRYKALIDWIDGLSMCG